MKLQSTQRSPGCVQEYYGIGVIPDLEDLYGEPNGPARQAALDHQFDAIAKLPGSVPTELDRIYHTVRGKIGFYMARKTNHSTERLLNESKIRRASNS